MVLLNSTNLESTSKGLEESLNLPNYWHVIKRRWVPASIAFAGVLGLFSIYALSLEPLFEAEAKLLIKSDLSSSLTGIESGAGQIDVISKDSNPLATEAEIFSSRPIIKKLIQELDLRDKKGKLVLYKDVIKELNVKPVIGTDVLEITYKDNDPELAASVVNQAIRIYKEQNTLSNRVEAQAASEFIREQLPQVEANVRQAEHKLRIFRNKHRIANLQEETSATITNLSNLKNQIDRLEADLESINARYKQLRSQLRIDWREASAISALSESAAVQSIFERLQQAKLELAQNQNLFTNNTPQVISLNKQVDDLQNLLEIEIDKVLGNERTYLPKNINILALRQVNRGQTIEFADLGLQREGLQQQLVSLKSIYKANQQRSDILPQLEEEQKELERRVEAAQSTYTTLLGKLQETQIAEEQNIGNARLVAEAVIPEEPVSFVKEKIVFVGGVLGVLVGTGVAFLLDIKDNKIKDTEEVEELLAYRLQGAIPHFKSFDSENQLLPGSYPLSKEKLVSPIKEAYQDIYVNLKFLESGADLKTIVITSAVSGEGKTTFSANYAASQAQLGTKVLLVDGDLRRPSQHGHWNINNQVGLADLLNEEVSWQEAVQNVIPNLDVLTAGTIPSNPVSLLNSLPMEILLTTLLKNYDLVIFDSPPLMGLADSKILCKLADGLLFIVRPGVADYGSVAEAKKILEATKVNVLGVVANGVEIDKESYRYGYYDANKKYYL